MFIGSFEGSIFRMERKVGGSFSLGFYSLQLQLKGLLQEAGGEKAMHLLDALSTLNAHEQEFAIQSFVATIDQIRKGELRLESDQDKAAQAIENKLYSDIVHCMQEAADANPRLEVVTGGKGKPDGIIRLDEVRKNRRLSARPLVN